MNFSPRWIGWIMKCVSTIEYTLLVNGSITQTFTLSKGPRQGDPISPYLFLMCANVLYIALLKVEQNQDIQGIKLGRNGCSFTHLLFVDYSLLFFKKTTSLSLIYKIPSNGIVPYQGKALILPNQIFYVLPTCLIKNKVPWPDCFK